MVSTVWLSPYSQTPTSGQFHICFETISMAGKKYYLSGVQKKLRAFSFTICLCNLDFLGRIINTNSFPQIKGLDRIAGIYRCRHRFHVLCQQFSMVNCFFFNPSDIFQTQENRVKKIMRHIDDRVIPVCCQRTSFAR